MARSHGLDRASKPRGKDNMRTHIVTCAVLLSLVASDKSRAALERIKYNNPGLVVDLGVGLWAWPLPMDYDGDGDYDIVVCCPAHRKHVRAGWLVALRASTVSLGGN